MTGWRAVRPARLALFSLLFVAAGIGACGKKGDVRAPEDERSAYGFPRPYPAPASVLPQAEKSPEEAPQEEAAPAPRELEPKKRERLSPFPSSPQRRRSLRI